MSLESFKKKEETTALDYACVAFKEEVDHELYESDLLHHLGRTDRMRRALVKYLNAQIGRQYWTQVLEQVGLADADKKKSEQFINAFAAAVVAPIIGELLTKVSPCIRSLIGRRVCKRNIRELDAVRDMAMNILGAADVHCPVLSKDAKWAAYQEEVEALCKRLSGGQ